MITRHSEKWDIIDLAAENGLAYITHYDNIYVQIGASMVQISTLKQLKRLLND